MTLLFLDGREVILFKNKLWDHWSASYGRDDRVAFDFGALWRFMGRGGPSFM